MAKRLMLFDELINVFRYKFFLKYEQAYLGDTYKTLIKEKYLNLDRYLFFTKIIKGKNKYVTTKNINVLECHLEMTKKQIIKKVGTPKYRINLNSKLETEVFYYKKKIGRENVKIEFHFYKGTVFFVSLLFKKKDVFSTVDVLKILKNKYNCNTIDFKNDYLIDSNQTILFVENINLNLNFSYFSLSSHFFNDLENTSILSKSQLAQQKLEKQIEVLSKNL